MKRVKQLSALALLLALLTALVPARAETMQDCHRVTMKYVDATQANKSVIREWQADTVLDSVDDELAQLTIDYIDMYGAELKPASSTTEGNSRLDVEIRYSRTGLTWLSFLVQARTTFHRALIGQDFTTRTYDMTTGQRILMTDLFEEDSEGWDRLADAVRDTVLTYFPDEDPDADALDEAVSRAGLEQAEFTLHGMSLVLHYLAKDFYPQHETMIEVTLMYPDIRPYMAEKAQEETDNLSYYKTCALTFDDGPSRTNTTKVLQTMMAAGARGTFFVIGNRIEDYTDLVQREHDEGHSIGMHNWHHGNVNSSNTAALRRMVGKCDKALTAAIGLTAKYDRVPYGLYPKMVKAKVGWPLIQWSLDTYDWRGRTTAQVLSAVTHQIEDGDIILCHDIKDNTPESARRIVKYLEDHGFLLLTIDELFAKDGVTLEPNEVYYRCTDGDYSKKERD